MEIFIRSTDPWMIKPRSQLPVHCLGSTESSGSQMSTEVEELWAQVVRLRKTAWKHYVLRLFLLTSRTSFYMIQEGTASTSFYPSQIWLVKLLSLWVQAKSVRLRSRYIAASNEIKKESTQGS
jgi:hypothetical protein